MSRINVRHDAENLLKYIREGMRVYDRDQGDIGRVDRVYPSPSSDPGLDWDEGSVTTRGPTPPRDILLQETVRVFEPDNLSEDLREHLLSQGFVRFSGSGILAADRYVVPDQIDRIDRDRVILKLPRRDLIST